MDKDLKRYTEEERKFAEDTFKAISNSFEKSFKEDEEIKNRWIRYH